MNVLLALGSNLDNPIAQVQKAVAALQQESDIEVLEQASLYSSSPRGPQDQDDYVNSAVLIDTPLNAIDLLKLTQRIENAFGRTKTRVWGERIIDIDIIFFGQENISIEDPDLQIPHREALVRDFVLIPCLEIAPHWRLPNGEALADYVNKCEHHDLVKIDINLACS